MDAKSIVTNSISQLNNRCYHIINLSFASIILGILFYSLLFRGDSHPIPALLTNITGLIPPSKGLSASFSELVRGNLEAASVLNPNSLRIFSFFIIQLFTRALVSLAIEGNWIRITRVIMIDAVYSASLFIICFAPLIKYTIDLFFKLI